MRVRLGDANPIFTREEMSGLQSCDAQARKNQNGSAKMAVHRL